MMMRGTKKHSIISFLKSYPQQKTRNIYQAGLLNFGEQIIGIKKRKGKKVTEEELKEFDKALLEYLNNGKTQEDYFKDVQKFAVWLQCKPPKTSDVKVSATPMLCSRSPPSLFKWYFVLAGLVSHVVWVWRTSMNLSAAGFLSLILESNCLYLSFIISRSYVLI
jgi:hypothetical protein